jgi:small ligand-binding sensory domain FIST
MSETARMCWASADATTSDPAEAVAACAQALRERLGEGPVDLALAFASGALASIHADRVRVGLQEALRPGTLAGVSARGVVTSAHEHEDGNRLSVLAGRLPGVEVRPFLLMPESWREPVETQEVFDLVAPGVRGAEVVLLFGDPFSLDAERVLALCNRFAPGVRVVGGLASGGVRPRLNRLFLNDWIAHEGGIAIALHGAIRVDTVVSQGCEPIGPPLDVTHVEQNVLVTLDGQPALERVEQVLAAVPEAERARLQQGLYVGRPARGEASGRGDYLIRNLLGADRERGIVAVGDRVGPRERIRLHVRDARTAQEDLEMLLSPQAFDAPAGGAVLIACNGRGRGLYGAPDRDIATLQAALGGSVPVAGCFAAGELGPVGERNFLHGHTASIAILRPR